MSEYATQLLNGDAKGTEAQAIIDLAAKVPVPLVEGQPHLVWMDGVVRDLSHLLPPTRVKATRAAHTTDSFTELVGRLDDSRHAVTFCDMPNVRFGSVIDFAENANLSRDEHVVVFSPQMTPEWLAWARLSGSQKTQVELANFIEEWLDTIIEPDAADLLELIQDVSGRKSVTFQSAQRLSDGRTQLQYVEDVSTTRTTPGTSGLVTIPPALKLSLPIFRGEAHVTLDAFLRYKIRDGGTLELTVKLQQQDSIVPDALSLIRDRIVDALEGRLVVDGWYT